MSVHSQPRPRTFRQAEFVVVAGLFAFAYFEFVRVGDPRGSLASHATATLLFALLAGGYLGLSLEPIRQALHQALSSGMHRRIVGPAVLLVAIALYAFASGSVTSVAVPYAVYLFVPVALLYESRDVKRRHIRQLATAVWLWLPIQFGFLKLRLAATYDATHLVAIVTGLYCFLILEPLEGIGYTYLLRRRDWSSAVAALLVYLIAAVPIGLSSGFLNWHPRLTTENLLVSPLHIYLAIGVPEELLFRGIIQNVCVRWIGLRWGLAAAAVVFGLAHLPDVRYVLLASLAGVAYGWVFWRTERITASAVTHAAVDWIWKLVFQR
jgi:membrane protease YdiL (CAAX protease family)